MNAEQLNAIKERAEKATPGPWEIDRNSDDDVFVTDVWFDGEDGGHAEIHGNTVASSIYNADFIANARQDIPALVAEIERLQQEVKAMYHAGYANAKRDVKLAQAKMELLRVEKDALK